MVQNSKNYKFYDVKAKKKFMPKTYKVEKKYVKGKMRSYGLAKSPFNNFMVWRTLPLK